MKKNLTELVFILDRSGSMGGLEQDTIGGFNAMLTRQKEQEGEANVTTILFDHEVQLLHDRFPLKAVAPLTEKDYYVRGCTALLDAIGYGVEKMVNIQRHLPEDERAEKVIFVITTDGLENASKRFGYKKIRRMIEREKEQYGWEFLFLGANMDAVKEAARFGISSDRAVRFENDAQGVAVNYHVVSETVCRMRQADCPASVGAAQAQAVFEKRRILPAERQNTRLRIVSKHSTRAGAVLSWFIHAVRTGQNIVLAVFCPADIGCRGGRFLFLPAPAQRAQRGCAACSKRVRRRWYSARCASV